MFLEANTLECKGSREHVARAFCSRERKFQGAKGPGSEWARVLLADSLQGGNWPGSKKAMITSKPNA